MRRESVDEYPETDRKRRGGPVAAAAARAGDGSGFVCGIAGGTQADDGRGICFPAGLGRRRKLCDWRVRWGTTGGDDGILSGCAFEATAYRACLGGVCFSIGAREGRRARAPGGGNQVGESATWDKLRSLDGGRNPGSGAASVQADGLSRV